jgi:hypothetical protein
MPVWLPVWDTHSCPSRFWRRIQCGAGALARVSSTREVIANSGDDSYENRQGHEFTHAAWSSNPNGFSR